LYISKVESEALISEVENISEENVPALMDLIEKNSEQKIDWVSVKDTSDLISERSQDKLKSVQDNNNRVKVYALLIIGVLAFTVVSLFVYAKKTDTPLHWKYIIFENSVIFMFVGVLEFLFFKHLASKYKPVSPDTLNQTVIARLRTYVNSS
jgi:hypothetical protein